MDSHFVVLMLVPVSCVGSGYLFASSPELIHALGTNRHVSACSEHIQK